MEPSARQALLIMARREAGADGHRSRLIGAVIAVPVACVAATVVLLGASFDAEPWAPAFLAIPLSPLNTVIWAFIVGLLFLVSLAAFSVGDQQSERTYRLITAAGAEPGHVQRLAVYRSLVPGTMGVIGGIVAGAVGGLLIATLAGYSLQPLHWISMPVGLAIPALLAWVGVLIGAWWPTRRFAGNPVATRAPTAAPTAVPAKPAPGRVGVVLVLGSLIALTVGSVGYNGIAPEWLPVPDQAVLAVLTVAPLVLIAGLIMMMPTLVGFVSSRLDGGPGWLRFAVLDLSRNRGRAGLAAGVTLGLTTLAVMAAAGLESDEDWYVELDRRYVVTEGTTPGTDEAIGRILAANGAAFDRVELTTLPVDVGLSQDDRNRIWRWEFFRAAVVDAELADALQLTDQHRRQLADGHVLLNTRSELFERGELQLGRLDDLPSMRIERGEGSDTALALLIGPDLMADSGVAASGSSIAYLSTESLSAETRRAVADAVGRDGGSVAVASLDPFDVIEFGDVLTGVLAVLAVTVGVLITVLALRADPATMNVVDDLGVGPIGRRLMAASQVGLQQLLAGVVGALTGVGLFRLVTLGDSSVPDWILPWPTITVMAVVVPMATAVMVGLLAPRRQTSHHHSGSPAPTAPH